MLIAHGFAGLGQSSQTATLTPEQLQVLNSGFALSEQETRLRQMYYGLLNSVAVLEQAGKSVGPGLLSLMQKHAAAVDAHFRAAKVFIDARDATPRDQLPDPDAQLVPIPTFAVPAGGGLGSAVPASAIRVRVGYAGRETFMPVAQAMRDVLPINATSGLGQVNPALMLLFRIFGLGVVATMIIVIIREWRGSSDKQIAAASLNKQSDNMVKITMSDYQIYTDTLTVCQGGGSTPPDQCIELAQKAVERLQKGRVPPKSPWLPTDTVTTVGTVALLGLAGYLAYRYARFRRISARDAAPRGGYTPSAGASRSGFRPAVVRPTPQSAAFDVEDV
jgi:hypothetical protein